MSSPWTLPPVVVHCGAELAATPRLTTFVSPDQEQHRPLSMQVAKSVPPQLVEVWALTVAVQVPPG
jgi:hypothetical protein